MNKAKPLDLDVILAEFPDDAFGWVLQDRSSSKYVTVPDPNYPGRKPIRFFLSRDDAERFLQELIDENRFMSNKEIYPIQVKLKRALRSIAADNTPGNADSFVVHSPNEVYEWLRDRA